MNTQTNVTLIHVGRLIRFSGGYGNIDGNGAIVAVHGTPNPAPSETFGSVGRFIRRADCTVDVILFDGRRLNAVHQCGIDMPGIGIKLLDETIDDVSHLPDIAAARESAQAIAKAKARADFEAGEAARVITDMPIFYANGIKDAKGAKLQKCSYSISELFNYPAETITIYARDYCNFSAKVSACFEIKNDTDIMIDYFDSDSIRVIPDHPLYAQVLAACNASKARFEKRLAKRAA